eukprot:INCI4785.4.p1 GENE.INCI4785.4~~INCI4785.4.p1  ORF type:complete len:351 (+),score=109.35 INCI4785.4:151-1053(+)
MPRGRKAGRHRNVQFAHSAEQIERRNARDAEYAAKRNSRRGIDGEEEDGSGNSNSSEEEDDESHVGAAAASELEKLRIDESELNELQRARLKAQRLLEAEKEEQAPVTAVLEEDVMSLNRGKKQNIKVSELAKAGAAAPQTRKEREMAEAARRKAEYDRRHAAGETEQAKKDLARLREVQARRKAAAARRAANPNTRPEGYVTPPSSDDDSDDDDSDSDSDRGASKKAAKKAAKKAKKAKKKAAAPSSDEEDKQPEKPKFTKIEAKKMNPSKMKELLKVLGEPTQGNKKQLLQRLLPHAS